MISLISEITDGKGSRAQRGWVCFDADCPFCVSLARRFQRVLAGHGYGLAALQDKRVQAQLALPRDQLLLEMRLLTREGKQFGGADALVYLAGQIWWAWPLWAIARLPGVRRCLRALYRRIAARRKCGGVGCSLSQSSLLPHAQEPKGGGKS